jgi:hypothetical protein
VKVLSILFIFILCPTVCCADYRLEDDTDSDAPRRFSEVRMLSEARNALMGYEIVQEKTQYFTNRLESVLLGEYSEKFLILAPFITGKVEFNALDMNFYVDAREETSGVRYIYNF